MLNSEELLNYEEQLQSVGIYEEAQQVQVLTFLYQLAAIGYGIMEERKIMNDKNGVL